MSEYVVKRQFKGILSTGVAAVVLCFVVALIYWPIWGMLVKAFGTALAIEGLKAVDAKVASKYMAVLAEGTFFWMVINAWIWQTLIFGNYGKNYFTDRQPGMGIWYALVGLVSGILGFLILIGFLGIWWKPFSLAVLFMPHTAEEVLLAIEGWEAGNFYVLPVIICQIPLVSLFHKWPFAGNIKAPWDGFGVMMTGSVFALIVWFAMFIPSFWKLSLGGHVIVSQPMGSWPAVLAFCQAFIFWFLVPAEGGEHYPMKMFTKKQPYMGLVGLAIALLMSWLTPMAFRAFMAPMDLLPGVPLDVQVASLELSVVIFMLTWHHLFDDWPTAAIVPDPVRRFWTRMAIWVSGGLVYGMIWLKTFKYLPFAGNDLGMGFPVMGVLAGQFALLMVFLYMNTFFDKWPLVKKVPAE